MNEIEILKNMRVSETKIIFALTGGRYDWNIFHDHRLIVLKGIPVFNSQKEISDYAEENFPNMEYISLKITRRSDGCVPSSFIVGPVVFLNETESMVFPNSHKDISLSVYGAMDSGFLCFKYSTKEFPKCAGLEIVENLERLAR